MSYVVLNIFFPPNGLIRLFDGWSGLVMAQVGLYMAQVGLEMVLVGLQKAQVDLQMALVAL